MPADFAGTVEYGNGSVAPPYHYDWVLRFDEATDDGMVGGPGGSSVEVTAHGRTHDPGSLGGSDASVRLLEDVADAVQELIPAELRDKQDVWSEQQPK
jgi:hypothetical protein